MSAGVWCTFLGTRSTVEKSTHTLVTSTLRKITVVYLKKKKVLRIAKDPTEPGTEQCPTDDKPV